MDKPTDKVAIIGAGAVGATLAQRVLESGLADVVLLDIAKDMAIAKSFDLLDASPVLGHERTIVGADDYSAIKDSSIVVITAGFARKPGMTREDLVKKNAAIVKDVSLKIKKNSPGAVIVVITNPLDVMTYLAYKTTGFNRERVLGMAGLLDASRFIYLVAHELKVPRSSVSAYIMGSHGDTMVPVVSKMLVGGRPITQVMGRDKLDPIIKRTRERGAEIVGLFGSGSAYYSPSAAAFKMIEAILKDSDEIHVVSAYLKGEYALSGVSIGVPCQLGRGGIKKIIELDLSEEEAKAFNKSAQAIKTNIESL